jgi:MraZ protein
MANQFHGRYEVKMDDKGRMSLPALLRQDSATATSFVITNSQIQGRRCLDVYALPEWQLLEERVARMSPLKREVQAFRRFYLASGLRLELDSNYRLLLPGGLRKYAGLETSLVVVGMGDKFEIWSEPTWTDLHEALASDFEETMGMIAGLEESR